MAGPYREESEPPLVRYALRTSWQAFLPTALGVPMVIGFAWLVYAFGRFAIGATGLLLLGMGVLLVAVGHYGVRPLRVAGGRGELRFFRDRVEVPRPYGREPLVLLRDAFHVSITEQVVRFVVLGIIPAGEMNRGFLLTLHYAGGTRVLSDKLFASEEIAMRALEDLQRFRTHQAPRGPDAPRERPPEATKDELDARIDDELRDL